MKIAALIILAVVGILMVLLGEAAHREDACLEPRPIARMGVAILCAALVLAFAV